MKLTPGDDSSRGQLCDNQGDCGRRREAKSSIQLGQIKDQVSWPSGNQGILDQNAGLSPTFSLDIELKFG